MLTLNSLRFLATSSDAVSSTSGSLTCLKIHLWLSRCFASARCLLSFASALLMKSFASAEMLLQYFGSKVSSPVVMAWNISCLVLPLKGGLPHSRM